MNVYKFLSSGGLGDSWIVFLKINEIINSRRDHDFHVDWLHLESHNKIKDQCEQLFGSLNKEKYKFTFECDPNYVANIRTGKWKDRQAISTSVDGFCDLHGQTIPLTEPFLVSYFDRAYDIAQPVGSSSESVPYRYDISIQVSAGAKNNRSWKFDPRHFAAILRSQGYNVALIGNDENFKDINDEDNFVCHSKYILDTTDIIRGSNLFIGLSGFLNYWACSMRVPSVHLIESAENEKRYYHEQWKNLSLGINYPSLKEVRSAIKTFENLNTFEAK